jgi:hypothetical protein
MLTIDGHNLPLVVFHRGPGGQPSQQQVQAMQKVLPPEVLRKMVRRSLALSPLLLA